MPPKPKFRKEDIINAAYEMARESGADAVKAREVGERLGSSSRPIFTFFNSMDELVDAVKERAWQTYGEYLKIADNYYPTFKKRGLQMIRFAEEEPKLFQMLFMNENEKMTFEEVIDKSLLGFSNDVELVKKQYDLTQEEAMKVFSHLWVHAYGICCFMASNVCTFGEEKLDEILGEMFAGILMLIKNPNRRDAGVHPAPKSSPEADRLNNINPAIQERVDEL